MTPEERAASRDFWDNVRSEAIKELHPAIDMGAWARDAMSDGSISGGEALDGAANAIPGNKIFEGAVKVGGKLFKRIPDCPPVQRKLPKNARTHADEQEAFRHLEAKHGINEALASERLHDIKKSAGRGPADNVIFDRTGGVYDPVTRQELGSLTQGGARRR